MRKSHPSNLFVTRGVLTVLLLTCLALLPLACRAEERFFAAPASPPSLAPEKGRSDPRTILATGEPSQGSAPTSPALLPALPDEAEFFACGDSALTAEILAQTSADRWIDWIEKLSGAEPVFINGQESTITTRFSQAMFAGLPHARAFEYVHQTVSAWYPSTQIEVMEYPYQDEQGNRFTWKNLVVEIPGAARPEEIVILSAHLDSISSGDPMRTAPGAEDNGSGSAALLEAARILRDYRFERTIQIVWFTGEELGLWGSRAFVQSIEDPDQVLGVINLDMFGYDSNNDRCFELHVGELPESQRVGQCFTTAIAANRLDLPRYDYLTRDATGASDHSRFWEAGIGAVEVLENMIAQEIPGGCQGSDPNAAYHTPGDTVDRINPTSGIEIVRAAIAALAGMAVPIR